MTSEMNNSAMVNSSDTGQAGQESLPPVTVSMKKLTAGVTTIFMGIVQMLEALEPQTMQRLVDIAVQGSAGETTNDVEPSQAADVVGTNYSGSAENGKEGDRVETETADTGVSTPAASDDGVPADRTDKVPELKQEDTTTATSVTEDDVTKIIVRKIKQDRSNNEKIGAILKTYGVAKVSDLPASKYESFLTDVSQL